MKAYIATSGAIFGLLVVAHILRVIQEPALARDPWFILVTAAAAALGVWAWRTFRRVPTQAGGLA
ncbi:MAG TPA: hypothetical protein VGS22_10700 [Thermoanaerobaculia bacterium]|jgi:hypothetical protein|nr:hypothetical protein [Thermoanaerobaculia bacterium]